MKLEIKDKEAIEWLRVLISNQLNKVGNEYTLANFNSLTIWNDALNPPEEAPEPEMKRTKPAAELVRKKVAKKKAAPPITNSVQFYECSDHTTYGGMRRPRTDCTICWEIYKRLHPMEFAQKRRQFEMKVNQG